jgi:hypothetical protein
VLLNMESAKRRTRVLSPPQSSGPLKSPGAKGEEGAKIHRGGPASRDRGTLAISWWPSAVRNGEDATFLHGCSGGFVLAARGQLHDEQGMSGAGQGACWPMPTAREGSRKDCRVADRLYTWRLDREMPHPWDASLGRESSRGWGLEQIIVVVCLHIRIRIRSVFPAGP